jgi:hypothetical protein
MLVLRFLGGSLYLAVVALMFSAATEITFLLAFLVVLCGALFCCGLAVAWMIGAVCCEDARPRQFGIRSLLFLTVYVSIYFSMVRWLANYAPNTPGSLPIIAAYCLVFGLISVPMLLFWTESLVWLAVWVVRRDCVQSWLAQRRKRIGEGGNDG